MKSDAPVEEGAGNVSRETERQLIVRARAGERAAMRELIDLHKDRLFGFIWRMIRNHHDAEDICQDAFLKAFASLDTFSVEYRFSTWLFTIGYRVCLNQLRRKRVLTGELDVAAVSLPEEDGRASPAESEEAGRLRETVWEAVSRLSTPQRATVVLFYRHGHSCQEIARVLQLPVATVKSHLHRARNRLREMLESLSEEDLQQFRNLSA
ncbi:MAG: RNA polymerase sigma factor [Planctomycetota bacterium]|jgi:RNA polymerase sigma-70 factor (ECF subfamily)